MSFYKMLFQANLLASTEETKSNTAKANSYQKQEDTMTRNKHKQN